MIDKTKFQVERIALFSDAVFAIAITLMVIEVKPPHLDHHITSAGAWQTIAKMTPMFVGVILSFIFIGVFWLRHHQLMKHMATYTPKLLWLNMVFLLTIVFLPFSTALVFENVSVNTPVPLIFYNVNYILAALANYRLFSYVLNPASGIMTADDPERIRHHRVELLYPIAVYLLVICLSFISVPMAPLGYATFGLQSLFLKKRKGAKESAIAEEDTLMATEPVN